MSRMANGPGRTLGALLALSLLLLASPLALPFASSHPGPVNAGPLRVAATPVHVDAFSFMPGSLSVGTPTTASVSLSGGSQPFYLWFNNTPSGCSAPSSPETVSAPSFQYSCNPSSSGTYPVHLDVLDSSSPRSHATLNANLSVSSNSGSNNNGSGNNGGNSKGNGSLSLPSGLQQLALIFGAVFLIAMLLIAAGTIATAVVLSRRLRQINETLAKSSPAPKDAKPPT
ncbi:MAG: hypothetical protein L3K13_06855 [Thermoplasmata archaeon]|nr:hypothetical protein [Thermoplasmata archaeon]